VKRFVLRIAEAGLGVAIWIAVLAFGGTSPPFFFLTQAILFVLGVFSLAASLRAPLTNLRFPVVVPASLIGLVLLQILPLPDFLGSRLDPMRYAGAAHAHNTISIAPYQTVSHLLLLVTYLTAFYLVLLVCEDRSAKKRLVYALVALGAFEAFYGLAQYLTGWQQIFAYVKRYYLEDATGTYINRNHFAGFLEMVLPFAVALALRSAGNLRRAAQRSEARARSILSSKELLPFIFWLFLVAVFFTAIIFSRSRMGIISALASLLAVLALAGSSTFSRRTRVVAAALFFLSVAGIVVWLGSDPVITRFENLGQDYSQTNQSRISIWRDTFHLIRRHPWFGTGFGTFSVAYTQVQTAFLTLLVDHAHCDYLEAASELGLPGAMLVFGSILWIFVRAVKRYRKADGYFDAAVCLGCIGSITGILVHSSADFNLYIPANGLVFAVILALAWMERGGSESTLESPMPYDARPSNSGGIA
jgi:putative inorganic carbon (hco3(-)) transporter